MKLGFMSTFVKASAEALLAIPAVNGVIDGTDIIYRDYCDISIAVATPKGLVVPVLRDADKLDFPGVERVSDGPAQASAVACDWTHISCFSWFGSLYPWRLPLVRCLHCSCSQEELRMVLTTFRSHSAPVAASAPVRNLGEQ